MGETGKDALRVGFDRTIKLAFHGARVSSDAGLFPYRNLDDTAGLTDSAGMKLVDLRTGGNIQHSMASLLRQSIYSRLAGYEDVNDAEATELRGSKRGILISIWPRIAGFSARSRLSISVVELGIASST